MAACLRAAAARSDRCAFAAALRGIKLRDRAGAVAACLRLRVEGIGAPPRPRSAASNYVIGPEPVAACLRLRVEGIGAPPRPRSAASNYVIGPEPAAAARGDWCASAAALRGIKLRDRAGAARGDRCTSAAALRIKFPEQVAASGQEPPLTCVWVPLSDAVLRSAPQPNPSCQHCENLGACSSAVSQRVWKSGGPTIAPLLCNVLCAASTFEHVCAHVNAHCSMSGKGPQEAVETSRHAVEAGHSTGGERGAASPFSFDAVERLRGRTAAALHVPGPNFDHRGEVRKKLPKDACYSVGAY